MLAAVTKVWRRNNELSNSLSGAEVLQELHAKLVA